MVKIVGSLVEFEEELKSAGEKLIVVDFSATWCGPCKMIKPFFHVYRDLSVALPQAAGYREETMLILLCLVNVLLQLCLNGHFTPDKSLCEKYGDVVFIEIDVDDAQDVASHCDVKCMPTFQFYKNGKKVQEFSGANKEKLEETIKSLV